MRPDELSLSEQLVASTAVAKYRNGTAVASAGTPTTALCTLNDQQPQSIAAFMPVMGIDAALARWESIQQFISRIMTPDLDFGTIPGSRKPSLLKPGAEKLTAFFGLAPEFDVVQRIEDWDGGFFHYEIKCRLIRDGQVRGEGLGSCNTRESKYIKRAAADVVNTVLKIAKKRALVDAVLNTTGASQFFTQDVEDMRDEPARGTREAQQTVAERKIAELRAAEQAARKPIEWPAADKAWTTRGQMREIFSRLREAIGEVEWQKAMYDAGVDSPAEFCNGHEARDCYGKLVAIATKDAQ